MYQNLLTSRSETVLYKAPYKWAISTANNIGPIYLATYIIICWVRARCSPTIYMIQRDKLAHLEASTCDLRLNIFHKHRLSTFSAQFVIIPVLITKSRKRLKINRKRNGTTVFNKYHAVDIIDIILSISLFPCNFIVWCIYILEEIKTIKIS